MYKLNNSVMTKVVAGDEMLSADALSPDSVRELVKNSMTKISIEIIVLIDLIVYGPWK